MAAAIGVSPSTVSKWESGENVPPLGELVRLGQALSVDPGWLAFGDLSAAPREGQGFYVHPDVPPEDAAAAIRAAQMVHEHEAREAGKGGDEAKKAG